MLGDNALGTIRNRSGIWQFLIAVRLSFAQYLMSEATDLLTD